VKALVFTYVLWPSICATLMMAADDADWITGGDWPAFHSAEGVA
jgi:hypothetical protein